MPEPQHTHLSDSLLGAPHPEDPDGLQTLSRQGKRTDHGQAEWKKKSSHASSCC